MKLNYQRPFLILYYLLDRTTKLLKIYDDDTIEINNTKGDGMTEEIKHFAVKATHLIWIIVLFVILFIGLHVSQTYRIDNVSANYAEVKFNLGELKGRVDANEDDVVRFQEWRDKFYYESLRKGGKSNVRKE